jgi:hypothetical protein
VAQPHLFDAVVMNGSGEVSEIQVKRPDAASRWIWGAFRLSGRAFHELHALWREPGRDDEYFGTLVNAYIARGGRALAVCTGRSYVDVGTIRGYRDAMTLLDRPAVAAGGEDVVNLRAAAP